VIDRDSLRSNAAYLRQVRPIDPDEIHEYVTGAPHPAVVRQALREEAFDLALVERADGTFVPAPSGPVDPPGWEPTAFPEAYGRIVEDALVERYGANWHRGDSGDALRTSIRRLKEEYYRGNDVEYDETAALGYAIYHLPDYYAAIVAVLDPLAREGLLPRRLRVLDVGAGSGGPALGLHDYLFGTPAVDAGGAGLDADGPFADGDANETGGEGADGDGEDAPALVDYHALEPSPAADLAERLFEATDRNFRTTVHWETAEAFDVDAAVADGPFDLICFANVLSELDDPVAVVERYREALADDGTLALVAPADRRTATTLRAVERAVVGDGDGDDLTVFAPTLRLWPGASPSDRGWSFDVAPDVEPPPFQRRLDEAGGGVEDDPGTFTNATVQFAYALLRPDGRRRVPLRASADRHARFADSERHVTNRIDALAVKLSHDLSAGGGANPVVRVGDGSEAVDHYAVCTRASALNRDLLEAPYGAVLSFENVLLLWNDDQESYNLVVDGETTVDALA
jgi:SAM-dependent methyltransferase